MLTIQTFWYICRTNHYENIEIPQVEMETDFALWKYYKPQFTEVDFENKAHASRKRPTYAVKNVQEETIHG